MITINRATSEDPDFRHLVTRLDEYLAILDGADHAFYAQYNGIGALKNTVVAYDDGLPVACGAFKEIAENTIEIKRMFTLESHRGKGIAKRVLRELETWAAELGYKKCQLETGRRQPDAVALYEKCGYKRIPNYGQYAADDNSVCFEKML